MMSMCPLTFTPLADPLDAKSWGGGRLAGNLGKPFDPAKNIGESWELSDLPGAETRVSQGPLAGTSLGELVKKWPTEVLGSPSLLQPRYRRNAANELELVGHGFPLVVKFIDARETLSVQAHPDDDYARAHENGAGKIEAWYVLEAPEGAKVIRGLSRGTTPERFRKALEEHALAEYLHAFDAAPGQMILIPPGTVHSIGSNILLLEIQQASDITYRVYDWNRTNDSANGESGGPRKLHVEDALAVMKFGQEPEPETCTPRLIEDGASKRYLGVRCDRFAIEVLELAGALADAPPPGRFVILNTVRGSAALHWEAGTLEMPYGSTVLVPAAMRPYTLVGANATVLRSFVP